MARNTEDTLVWVVGAILLIVILSQVGIVPQFAIVTKTTCVNNAISEWELDGNIFDTKGLGNGVNHGGTFVAGKFDQAIQFNGNNESYIDLPSISGDRVMWIKNNNGVGYNYFANINGTNYVNTVQSSQQTPVIGPGFGKNMNVTVDRVAVFTSLSLVDMKDLYANGTGADVCWQTQEEVNVTCKDYAISQISDNSTGSLSVIGEDYPSCDFTWKSTQYGITDNKCVKSFFYQNSCLEAGNCYQTNSACIKDLRYECYVLQNNECLKNTDYDTCVVGNNYDDLLSCNEDVTTTSTASIVTPQQSVKDKLNEEILNVGGFSVTLVTLIAFLVALVAVLYFTGKNN